MLLVFIFRVFQAPKVQVEQKEAWVTRLAYNNNSNKNIAIFLNTHKYLYKNYRIYIAYLIFSIYHTSE